MAECRSPWQFAAAVAGCAVLLGCASAPPVQPDRASVLSVSESELQHASPAAYDELKEGLRWIARDAPGTNAAASPDPQVSHVDEPAIVASVAKPPVLIAAEPIVVSPIETPPIAATPIAVAPIERRSTLSYVTTSRLNLRRGPSLDWPVLTTLPTGTEISRLGRSGPWIRVTTPAGDGWVHQNWLQEVGSVGPWVSDETLSAAERTSLLVNGAKQ